MKSFKIFQIFTLSAAFLFLGNNAMAQADDLHDFHPDQFPKDLSEINKHRGDTGNAQMMPAGAQPQTAVYRDNSCTCVLGVGETRAISEGTTVLKSKNNQYSLIFTKDGMQLWKGANGTKTKSLWSATFNNASTGNLEVTNSGDFSFKEANTIKWAAANRGGGMGNPVHNGYYVKLQDDGNLVLYAPSGFAMWATDTTNK